MIVLTLLMCGMSVSNHAVSQQKVLDRVIAVVGKEAILQSDVNSQVEFYALSNQIDPNTPGLRQQVLDAIINERLIRVSALADTTINVRDEDVSRQLDELIAQRVQQVGSEARLEELYGMSIAKMKREFREETRNQLMSQQLQQAKFGDIHVSRREVEEFYQSYKDSLPVVPEEVELYHIFRVPKAGEAARSEVRAKAQRVLDSIRAGGDFEDFARRYSEDRGSASAGGDLGSWRRGQFVKEFEEIVFGLKENQISDVVETQFGFHVIQLMERRGESVHARHILFKVGRDVSQVDSTKAFLNLLRDSVLVNGVSFTELAKRHSEDKESGPTGGFIGRYPIEQFDRSVVDVVKTMKEGEISPPVEVSSGSTTGYHILYLKKRIPEHRMNLAEDWKRLEQLSTNYKRSIQYQAWIDQLKKDIYWEVRL
jgi:peptidyl-prolyl cis-trans isomerase SurA